MPFSTVFDFINKGLIAKAAGKRQMESFIPLKLLTIPYFALI